MTVTQNSPAPYAGSATIIDLIRRHRNKGLPSPVDSEVLERSGITQSLIARTLQALQILDLIDDKGQQTEIFEALRLAPEAEYKSRFFEWLKTAYSDAFQFIDVANTNETEIRDAFRKYKPVGQQERMVSLFIGLLEEAGVSIERNRQRNKSVPKTKENIRRIKVTPNTPVSNLAKHNSHIPPPNPPAPHKEHSGLINKLLDKFPQFDPNWTPEIQAKWFEGYQKLLAMDEKR